MKEPIDFLVEDYKLLLDFLANLIRVKYVTLQGSKKIAKFLRLERKKFEKYTKELKGR